MLNVTFRSTAASYGITSAKGCNDVIAERPWKLQQPVVTIQLSELVNVPGSTED